MFNLQCSKFESDTWETIHRVQYASPRSLLHVDRWNLKLQWNLPAEKAARHSKMAPIGDSKEEERGVNAILLGPPGSGKGTQVKISTPLSLDDKHDKVLKQQKHIGSIDLSLELSHTFYLIVIEKEKERNLTKRNCMRCLFWSRSTWIYACTHGRFLIDHWSLKLIYFITGTKVGWEVLCLPPVNR